MARSSSTDAAPRIQHNHIPMPQTFHFSDSSEESGNYTNSPARASTPTLPMEAMPKICPMTVALDSAPASNEKHTTPSSYKDDPAPHDKTAHHPLPRPIGQHEAQEIARQPTPAHKHISMMDLPFPRKTRPCEVVGCDEPNIWSVGSRLRRASNYCEEHTCRRPVSVTKSFCTKPRGPLSRYCSEHGKCDIWSPHKCSAHAPRGTGQIIYPWLCSKHLPMQVNLANYRPRYK